MLNIPHSVVHELRHHAERAYPEECCGVLLGSGDGEEREVVEARACGNADPDRRTRYAIAPQELIATQRAARERGLAIVGFYHSHPDHAAEPSATDRAEAAWPEAVYVIVSVAAKGAAEIKAFRWAERDDRPPEAENIALRVTSD
ncbi:MAG: M67 family metallopeptidase [Candidatus Koribacter versatilis]|uniref:M67 family metallopeptidase n=1 Tax=Candidatus Korobacter versatilis TaxID=658062 RepID=A0A932A8B5_9BACT|nr:M67 family metallopeptidase [Candidatus Koribacter versatilis]